MLECSIGQVHPQAEIHFYYVTRSELMQGNLQFLHTVLCAV
jgi:hypothetical protein